MFMHRTVSTSMSARLHGACACALKARTGSNAPTQRPAQLEPAQTRSVVFDKLLTSTAMSNPAAIPLVSDWSKSDHADRI
jgi:hypothetical protein